MAAPRLSKRVANVFLRLCEVEAKPFGVQVTLIEPGDFRTRITTNRVVAAASSEALDYVDRQRAAVEVIAKEEQSGADPLRLAVLLSKLIDRRCVRHRYLGGMYFQKMAVWAKRFLPASVFETLIMNHYKI